ncbi:spore photoproduct lyase [Paenibacillus sp. LMG 31456]|uniref:Spore photoproduct lyase n=1 Tax=Paenibacillus foliorum TaxID=2654974 RepID=A0A972GYX8_9BACL|nr:spore photoproduct lyase [Paenibacillus foliorum]NOU97079.1 spore photoproduct lyase [Paenibacillus foliorum]
MSTGLLVPPMRQTQVFVPELVYFEPDALNYSKGQRIFEWAQQQGLPIHMTTSHNRITNLPGDSDIEKYKIAKRTLVVGIRKTLKFEPSKPSAEYAIPIATGCMAHCHYCYLQTTLGAKPYIRVYVNTDDIMKAAKQYIEERAPEITRFEAACTSDPVGLEHISGSLKELIEFMAQEPLGRLRFVTKFHHVEPLLHLKHNKHTRFRFSVNADYVIKNFEPATSSFYERISAAGKVAQAGYPLGFIIAPIIWHEGWEKGYQELLEKLKEALPSEATSDLTFELIQHRFTKTAKTVIQQRYPKTKLELDETKRKYKWGRWGQGKYVYSDDQANALREFITEQIFEKFPQSSIDYFT